ncbi:MAG TPA: GntR family transcriptional regulator [Steroidobacteraceae bacterium]|nr:GntR family transcriptional regulator [Steroidobacteraceae bacterium]
MTTTTKSGAGVSRYLRLYRVLSQALAEGRFGPREPLPSEPRLMRDYGVSRSTVRRALGRLEDEGRIERRRGSGTFPREQRGEGAGSKDLSPMLDATASAPAAATSRTVAFQHIPTPAFLLHEGPGFGATTLLIRQIRYLEREPMVLETAYVPEEIGGGLTRRRPGAGGSAILADLAALGHSCASLQREFAAVGADPLAAHSLGLDVGAPVVNVRTLARDSRDRILAHVNCLYRPDRYEAHAAINIGGHKRRRKGKRS